MAAANFRLARELQPYTDPVVSEFQARLTFLGFVHGGASGGQWAAVRGLAAEG